MNNGVLAGTCWRVNCLHPITMSGFLCCCTVKRYRCVSTFVTMTCEAWCWRGAERTLDSWPSRCVWTLDPQGACYLCQGHTGGEHNTLIIKLMRNGYRVYWCIMSFDAWNRNLKTTKWLHHYYMSYFLHWNIYFLWIGWWIVIYSVFINLITYMNVHFLLQI